MNLSRNISSNEMAIRIVAGLLLMTIAIAVMGIGSFFGFVFLIIGTILAGTAIVSYCPVYEKLGKNTFRG